MPETSPAQMKASIKYNKDNVKQFKIALNKKTDKDIIEHLETIPNKQKYVKDLIRNNMK